MSDVSKASYENTVFIGDSRQMLELPDNSVGLVVTSPPYFNIKDYEKDGRQESSHSKAHGSQIGDISNFKDFIGELELVWKECARVLKPNGKLIVNTPLMPMLKKEFSTHPNRHIFDLNAEIQSSILANISDMFLMDTYIWNRTNSSKRLMFGSYPFPSNFYAQNTVEFVTVYVKDGKAWKVDRSIKEKDRLSQEEWVDFTKQIWNFPIPGKNDPAFGTHAALMPEQLAERCIRLFSLSEDIVLDPFAGSGTTLRVAKKLGRKFVGYELVGSYKEIIELKVGNGVCKVARKTIQKKPKLVEIINETPSTILNSLKVCDYEKLLEQLPENSVDLICVDPPYNMKKADWDTFESDSEFFAFTRKWIIKASEKLKPGGGFFVFNTPRNSAYILSILEDIGLDFRNWITWNKKDGFSSTKLRFLPEQETILYFTKPGGTRNFNFDNIRIPYESESRIKAAATKGILKNGKRWYPNENGRLCSDVWVFPSERHGNKLKGKTQMALHPTIKPIALMERIILASTNPGDVVLDFFAGSGSTLVAAKMHKRDYVGCDMNADYVKIARNRLKDV